MSKIKDGKGIEFSNLIELLGVNPDFVLETFDINPDDAVGEISCEVLDNEESNYKKFVKEYTIKIAGEIVIRLANEKDPSALIDFDVYDSSRFGRHIYEIAEDLAFAFICKESEKFRWYVECAPKVKYEKAD